MSLGEVEQSNMWGQFVDIEDSSIETKPSRQNRFLSLFGFYNNSSSTVSSSPGVNLKQKQNSGVSSGKTNDIPVEQPHEDSDVEDYNDPYDSVSSSSSDSEDEENDEPNEEFRNENMSALVKPVRPLGDSNSITNCTSKQNNASGLMKKIYRSVSINKSKRSSAILPENVLRQSYNDFEGKQTDSCTDCSESNYLRPTIKSDIEIVPQEDHCTSDSSDLNSRRASSDSDGCRTICLSVDSEKGQSICLTVAEAAAILIALHPKASKDINIARKLKLQFEKADEDKQLQVVSRLPRNKLVTLLASLRHAHTRTTSQNRSS